jgi:hypothetical protein
MERRDFLVSAAGLAAIPSLAIEGNGAAGQSVPDGQPPAFVFVQMFDHGDRRVRDVRGTRQALSRWGSREKGAIRKTPFIPLASESRFALGWGEWEPTKPEPRRIDGEWSIGSDAEWQEWYAKKLKMGLPVTWVDVPKNLAEGAELFYDADESPLMTREEALEAIAAHNEAAAERQQAEKGTMIGAEWMYLIEVAESIPSAMMTHYVESNGMGVMVREHYTPVRVTEPTAEEFSRFRIEHVATA